ncbi:MAG: hypothetical protein QOF30_1068, partial [Acidimicrobiaceae bacterium]|nr:hypothetical protein [Acidimicrobiaceae bacterium]
WPEGANGDRALVTVVVHTDLALALKRVDPEDKVKSA